MDCTLGLLPNGRILDQAFFIRVLAKLIVLCSLARKGTQCFGCFGGISVNLHAVKALCFVLNSFQVRHSLKVGMHFFSWSSCIKWTFLCLRTGRNSSWGSVFSHQKSCCCPQASWKAPQGRFLNISSKIGWTGHKIKLIPLCIILCMITLHQLL